MRPVLAIDPGATGAGALLAADGATVLACWSWVERKRKAGTVYAVEGRWCRLADSRELDTLHAVGAWMALQARTADAEGYVLVVEGLFVPRRRRGQDEGKHAGQVRSTLTLAESTGMLMGPLLESSAELHRPSAGTWRPAVLGLASNVSSDIAERVARNLVKATMQGQGRLGENPHVAEALCMARWGWVQQTPKRRRVAR